MFHTLIYLLCVNRSAIFFFLKCNFLENNVSYTNFFFVLTDCAILWYDTEATTLTSGEQIESDLSSSVIQFYKFEVEVDLSSLYYVTFIESLAIRFAK
jgi:hypothetical protein